MKPGDIVGGKYELTRLVAQGAMGAVYEARHVELQRTVAVKALRPELCGDEESTKRFVREARAAATIASEHIAAVTDVGQGPDGAPYLVMEYLEGETLARVLRAEGRLEPSRAARVGMQLCWALAAAHDKGIVHRDMKPDNIFLIPRPDGSELVKIVDFGIAKVLSSVNPTATHLTAAGTTLGTPYYMAPEQARGERDLDGRVDLYSVGVVLYEMLTGKQPFTGTSFTAIVVAATSTDAVPPSQLCPDVSRELEAVVLRAMARERGRRPASALELAEALEPHAAAPQPRASFRPELLGAAGAPRGSVGPPTEKVQPALRSPRSAVGWLLAVALGGLAVILAAVGVGGWLLYQSGVETGEARATAESAASTVPAGPAPQALPVGGAQPALPGRPLGGPPGGLAAGIGAEPLVAPPPDKPPDTRDPAAVMARRSSAALDEAQRLTKVADYAGCVRALNGAGPTPRIAEKRGFCLERTEPIARACALAQGCAREPECDAFASSRCSGPQ